jgi:DNA-binding IclR family transcriptional regulator
VQGFRAVSAPVYQDRHVVAALAIVGTTSSIPGDPRSPQARAVHDAAARLSSELGFLRSASSD